MAYKDGERRGSKDTHAEEELNISNSLDAVESGELRSDAAQMKKNVRKYQDELKEEHRNVRLCLEMIKEICRTRDGTDSKLVKQVKDAQEAIPLLGLNSEVYMEVLVFT